MFYKPYHQVFSILELSKQFTYQTYCDFFQPFFEQKNKQIQSISEDSSVLCRKTNDLID